MLAKKRPAEKKDRSMRFLEYVLIFSLGITGALVYARFKQRRGTKDYLEKLIKTWIIQPKPKKVPIKKLAVLTVDTARYLYGGESRKNIPSAAEIVKEVAEDLNYVLKKKQWSKVRIEARKLIKNPIQLKEAIAGL
jgi:hypothetical protein